MKARSLGQNLMTGPCSGDLGRSIEVAKHCAAQVGSEANEDVPGEGDRHVRAGQRDWAGPANPASLQA